jgi:hypothetical protein
MLQYKLFRLVIVVMFLVSGAAPILATAQTISLEELNKHFYSQNPETKKEWKTYINPEYKFMMGYPYSGKGNFASNDHGITILGNTTNDILDSSTPLLILITPKNDTEDIKPYVESWLRNDLPSENVTVFESIHPVSCANTSGYEYATFNGRDTLDTKIFLDNGKQIFIFSSFDQIYDFKVDEIRKVANSIKFFD